MSHMLKAIVGMSLLAGCASVPVPQERIVASQSAIRAAEEVGAPNIPTAALHLQLAREQADQAKVLIEDQQNHRAEMLLMRAEADAELALALAREETARSDAQKALDEVKTLQQRTQ